MVVVVLTLSSMMDICRKDKLKMRLHAVFACIVMCSCAALSLQVNDGSGNSEKDATDIIGYSAYKENEASVQHVDHVEYHGYASRQRNKRSRTLLVRQGLLFTRGLLARKKILNRAKFTRTDGKVTHYEKGGGYSQMRADFQYAAKASNIKLDARDGFYQGNVVDFGDMTIKYVDSKALSGKAADEPVLKILLKDKDGYVFKEDWVHYKYIDNVDR